MLNPLFFYFFTAKSSEIPICSWPNLAFSYFFIALLVKSQSFPCLARYINPNIFHVFQAFLPSSWVCFRGDYWFSQVEHQAFKGIYKDEFTYFSWGPLQQIQPFLHHIEKNTILHGMWSYPFYMFPFHEHPHHTVWKKWDEPPINWCKISQPSTVKFPIFPSQRSPRWSQDIMARKELPGGGGTKAVAPPAGAEKVSVGCSMVIFLWWWIPFGNLT